ncbi:hypothetical protein I302_108546 [Kwoniella bestiolae CBS 10118]|uniref:BRCT domain-containing protein n=1 Tax=Kwoniella bestiolae CBS 10118 TaxID=1296100 RepID=A0A1B9FVG1_9TREE|nr:hypothetical protein I302_07081 [Kwoniella bestiolae CBS 10118]OCF22741.1 hypothetical protein I302_07081 [Kwoniella bestiolae CBS 10118]
MLNPLYYGSLPSESSKRAQEEQESNKEKENDRIFFDMVFFNQCFWVVGNPQRAELMKGDIIKNGGTMSPSLLRATRVIFLKPDDLTECLKAVNILKSVIESHKADGNGAPLAEGWVNDCLILGRSIEMRPYWINEQNLFDDIYWAGIGGGIEKGRDKEKITSALKKKTPKRTKTVHFPSTPTSSKDKSSLVPYSSSTSIATCSAPSSPASVARSNQAQRPPIQLGHNTPQADLRPVQQTINVSARSFSDDTSSTPTGDKRISDPKWTTQPVHPGQSTPETSSSRTRSRSESYKNATQGSTHILQFTTKDNIPPETNSIAHARQLDNPITLRTHSQAGRANDNVSSPNVPPNDKDIDPILTNSRPITPQEELQVSQSQRSISQREGRSSSSISDPLTREGSTHLLDANDDDHNKDPSYTEKEEEPKKVLSQSKSAVYNRKWRNQASVQSQDQVAYDALVDDLKSKVADGGFPKGGMKSYLIGRGIHSLYTKYGTLIRSQVPGLPDSRANFKAAAVGGVNPKWQKFIDEQKKTSKNGEEGEE